VAEPYLFQLSMEKAGWVFARQAVISANVANANSPGYKAQDVRPFSEALEGSAISQSVSSPLHIASASVSSSAGVGTVEEAPWETFVSGQNVNLEQEMIKAADVSAEYRLNTSIIRTFHSMFMTVAGG
jgi:flagellar basal-body rod protein FlgB